MKKIKFKKAQRPIGRAGTFVLVVVVVVVMMYIITGPAMGAVKARKCRAQGGECANKIPGNTLSKDCPEQAGGYSYIRLGGIECEEGGTKYQCCRKYMKVEEKKPDSGTALESGALYDTKLKQEQAAAKSKIMKNVGDDLQEAQTIAAEAAKSSYVSIYDTSKALINNDYAQNVQYYDEFKNQIFDNIENPSQGPMDRPTVVAYDAIATVLVSLDKTGLFKDPDADPTNGICVIWSMLMKTYMEGYWYHDDVSSYVEVNQKLQPIALKIFNYMRKTYSDSPKHFQEADGQLFDNCQVVLGDINDFNDIKECRTAIIANKGIVDPEYHTCANVKGLLSNNALSPAIAKFKDDLFQETDMLIRDIR